MTRRNAAEFGSIVWAVGGAGMAMSSLGQVNDDATVFVGAASALFPLCALAAALALHFRHDRIAGLLLVASAATPTYFAFAVNVLVLVFGIVLVARPALILGPRNQPAAAA
jgi:hypothetical protein